MLPQREISILQPLDTNADEPHLYLKIKRNLQKHGFCFLHLNIKENDITIMKTSLMKRLEEQQEHFRHAITKSNLKTKYNGVALIDTYPRKAIILQMCTGIQCLFSFLLGTSDIHNAYDIPQVVLPKEKQVYYGLNFTNGVTGLYTLTEQYIFDEQYKVPTGTLILYKTEMASTLFNPNQTSNTWMGIRITYWREDIFNELTRDALFLTGGFGVFIPGTGTNRHIQEKRLAKVRTEFNKTQVQQIEAYIAQYNGKPFPSQPVWNTNKRGQSSLSYTNVDRNYNKHHCYHPDCVNSNKIYANLKLHITKAHPAVQTEQTGKESVTQNIVIKHTIPGGKIQEKRKLTCVSTSAVIPNIPTKRHIEEDEETTTKEKAQYAEEKTQGRIYNRLSLNRKRLKHNKTEETPSETYLPDLPEVGLQSTSSTHQELFDFGVKHFKDKLKDLQEDNCEESGKLNDHFVPPHLPEIDTTESDEHDDAMEMEQDEDDSYAGLRRDLYLSFDSDDDDQIDDDDMERETELKTNQQTYEPFYVTDVDGKNVFKLPDIKEMCPELQDPGYIAGLTPDMKQQYKSIMNKYSDKFYNIIENYNKFGRNKQKNAEIEQVTNTTQSKEKIKNVNKENQIPSSSHYRWKLEQLDYVPHRYRQFCSEEPREYIHCLNKPLEIPAESYDFSLKDPRHTDSIKRAEKIPSKEYTQMTKQQNVHNQDVYYSEASDFYQRPSLKELEDVLKEVAKTCEVKENRMQQNTLDSGLSHIFDNDSFYDSFCEEDSQSVVNDFDSTCVSSTRIKNHKNLEVNIPDFLRLKYDVCLELMKYDPAHDIATYKRKPLFCSDKKQFRADFLSDHVFCDMFYFHDKTKQVTPTEMACHPVYSNFVCYVKLKQTNVVYEIRGACTINNVLTIFYHGMKMIQTNKKTMKNADKSTKDDVCYVIQQENDEVEKGKVYNVLRRPRSFTNNNSTHQHVYPEPLKPQYKQHENTTSSTTQHVRHTGWPIGMNRPHASGTILSTKSDTPPQEHENRHKKVQTAFTYLPNLNYKEERSLVNGVCSVVNIPRDKQERCDLFAKFLSQQFMEKFHKELHFQKVKTVAENILDICQSQETHLKIKKVLAVKMPEDLDGLIKSHMLAKTNIIRIALDMLLVQNDLNDVKKKELVKIARANLGILNEIRHKDVSFRKMYEGTHEGIGLTEILIFGIVINEGEFIKALRFYDTIVE